ncbi:MAG: glycosyltransferase family 4 protein [Phycisphaerae bacterium]
MSIRVCHVSTVHPASDVRVFHRECCSLARAGYDVHLVIGALRSSVQSGVHIHAIRRVRRRFWRMLVMPWVALRSALKTNARIYHLHDPELMPVGFVLRWILSKRVVYDIHEAVPRQIMSKEWLPRWARRTVAGTYRSLERLLTPGLAIVLANEGSVGDYAASAYLVQNYPLLNPRYVDLGNKHTKKPVPPMLVYLGGVSRQRGGDVYLRLARRLMQRQHDFRMLIIGPHSEEYGRSLRSTIESWDLGDRVTLTGRMDYDQAMEVVSRATIGLCLLLPVPNYMSCLATKILEYMMLGTPVLASSFDCWRRYVEGERVGLMADPCDIDDVVATCERLLARKDELLAMGRRGAAAVRERYNWASELDNLKRCYDDLLRGERRSERRATPKPADQTNEG